MSTFTHLAQLFFFWLLSKPLSNTESHPLWLLVCAFVLFISKLREYRSKQHILIQAKVQELGVYKVLREIQLLFSYLLGALFCLMKTLVAVSLFSYRRDCDHLVVAILINPWGDHCAQPLSHGLLSLESPSASEKSLYRICTLIPIFTIAQDGCSSDSCVSVKCES